jgi:hypothetical protein
MKCSICENRVIGHGFVTLVSDVEAGLGFALLHADGFTLREEDTVLCGKHCALEWFSGQLDKLMGIAPTAHMAAPAGGRS